MGFAPEDHRGDQEPDQDKHKLERQDIRRVEVKGETVSLERSRVQASIVILSIRSRHREL